MSEVAETSSTVDQKQKPSLDEGWHPGHNPWLVALTVTIATFMEVMDTSIANVALPHIAGGLSAGQDESTWVLTSYLVANAAILPISAWLADRYGRKRFYMTCVALFTISSFLCGFAPSLGLLVFFRVLQGAAGGGLGPSEQAILADTLPARQRGMGFAIYGMAVVLAPAIGPTLGGWITDHYSWRWIFYVNVPFGVLSLWLSSIMVSDPPWLDRSRKKAEKTGVDGLGLALVAISLGSFQVVLDKGQRDDWFGSPFITSFAVTAVVGMTVFIFWEMRHPHPVVNLRLFRNRNFAACNLLMFLLGAVLLGTTVLIPQFLQTLLGYTAQKAGEVLTPGGFAIILLLPMVGFLVNKVDPRFLIAFGFLLSGLTLIQLSHITLGIDFQTAIWWRVDQAASLAFLFVPINTIAYIDIPQEENNQVSSLVNLMRNLGSSVGISVFSTMLERRQQVHQNYLVRNLYPGAVPYQRYLDSMQQRFHTGGFDPVTASQKALSSVGQMLGQQSASLAYIDIIQIFSIVSFCAIPIVLLAKRGKPGRAAMGH